MKEIIAYGLLLVLPMIGFAAEEKNNPELNLEVKIVGQQGEAFSTLFINSEKLREYEYFTKMISHEEYQIIVSSRSEAIAFGKMIDFINGEPPILEPDDLLDLILLTLRYDLVPLGDLIAQAISQEIYNTFNKEPNNIVVIGCLNKQQFESFYSIIKYKIGEHRWLKTIQQSLHDYITYLLFHKDNKGCKFKHDMEPNLLVQCRVIEERYQKKCVQQAFDDKVTQVSAEIFSRVEQLFSMGQGKEKMPELSFEVSGKYAESIRERLEGQLYNFEVSLNVIDWTHESNLCGEEPWPRTLGGHCANVCAWTLWIASLSVQMMTLNYCCYCNNCCQGSALDVTLLGSQCGGAVRHCLYKSGSCGKRLIIVKPKATPGLESLMPPIETDMFRDWASKV